MTEKKPICLHFHIFKNAGTTIDLMLERNFAEKAVRMDVDIPSDILPTELVIDYLSKNPEVKSFSSHQMRFPIPKDTNFNLLPMVFIRQPLDRIFSIYSFNKRRNDVTTIGAARAKTSTLPEYVEWQLNHKTNMSMKNFQVLYLSRDTTKIEVGLNDLNLAIQRIKECSIIGIVDRLDQSLVLAQEILRKYYPKINLSYVSQNVSKDRKDTLEERLQAGRSDLGDALWEKLNAKNELDLQLYSQTNKEFDKRIEKIENFEEKLKKFREESQKKENQLPQESMSFHSRRIWYSPENLSLYFKNTKKGTRKVIQFFAKSE